MRRGAAVSVIDDPAAFRQQVRMAAVQVAGLKADEIESALAYEVEPSSGIPAAEAELAYRLVAGDDPTVRVYEVFVRRRKSNAAAGGERCLLPLAIIGAAVLLSVAVDAALTIRAQTRLARDVAEREMLDAKIKAVQREARAARDEADGIRARRASAAKAQGDVSRFRAAWPALLRAIGSSFGDRAVVTSLDSRDPFRARLTATAVSQRAAADVMVALTAAAQGLNWRVTPGTMAVSARGTTTTFDCELEYD